MNIFNRTGLTSLEESSRYLRDQQRHHNIVVLGLAMFTRFSLNPPSGGYGNTSFGFAEEAKAEWVYKGEALIFIINFFQSKIIPINPNLEDR